MDEESILQSLSTGAGANGNGSGSSNTTNHQEYSMAVMPEQISGIQQLLNSKYAKGSGSNLNLYPAHMFGSPASETTMGVTPISNTAVGGVSSLQNKNQFPELSLSDNQNPELMNQILSRKLVANSINQIQTQGRVAIFWDLENCAPPQGMPGFLVVENLRNVVQHFGPITLFKAYLEINDNGQKKAWRSELQSSGVSLTDCPHNGRKDSVDKMILVDMLAFAIDNPAPATIVLISGDRDFVYALSVLRNRCYTVVLIVPNKGAPIILRSQANAILEWKYDVLKFDAWKDAINNTPLNPINQGVVTLPQSLPKSSSSSALNNYLDRSALQNLQIAPIDRNQQQNASTQYSGKATSNSLSTSPPPNASSMSTSVPPGFSVGSAAKPSVSSVQTKAKQEPIPFSSSPLTLASNRDQVDVKKYGSNSSLNAISNAVPSQSSNHTSMANLRLDEDGFIQSPRAPGFFDCLVEVLTQFHLSGDPKPLRSKVGHVLIQRNPFIYQRAGVSSFKDFSDLAVQEGIVQMGGEKASAWIALSNISNPENNSSYYESETKRRSS